MSTDPQRSAEDHAPEAPPPVDDTVVDDADVLARVAAGELVPLPSWGEPPVRPEWLAQLRANVAQTRARAAERAKE
jgi:hypothetical protein